ncbi:hypothetical protein [Frigoribacterium sp. CG_9.8]|uniref:hypothetical protein n=1 Tax=Frigoribacterium sp. CG_9.8 TaxID=2787733 RepID=UPI0018C9A9B5|nr:hypothetical protein [Frigoribacterium sp. CG_9.8]MBG6106565.1 hypothetical protein [Frigoribacterium sp. CG_9.8]
MTPDEKYREGETLRTPRERTYIAPDGRQYVPHINERGCLMMTEEFFDQMMKDMGCTEVTE